MSIPQAMMNNHQELTRPILATHPMCFQEKKRDALAAQLNEKEVRLLDSRRM
jgi:hypothetical protein